jgi:hypothetical protein
MDERPTRAATWGRTIAAGIGWGIVGAVVMGLFAMIAAATYQKTGFFTPMYHIASTFVDPKPMMQSMESAQGGDLFFFSAGTASIGMMTHLAVGAAYGVAFAIIARLARLRSLAALGFGVIYGLVVLLFSSFIGLPVAASIFGGGDPISTMPTMVGWPTFTVEHIIYGLVLGIGALVSSSAFYSPEGVRARPETHPA